MHESVFDLNLIGPTILPIPPFTFPTESTGPTGSISTNRIYVRNPNSNNVSVIDRITNSVIKIIPVGNAPVGVGVNP
ncbi:exosporium leader peptide-containing protein [Bacillus cereus]|uniref:exosporium leader peptide-containing protein n=1 Tax=Bacillus cereus TaxID=1396 RepID=UPI002414248E|nr:exosporium leader peptide-containing protein [Bacillus cereus]